MPPEGAPAEVLSLQTTDHSQVDTARFVAKGDEAPTEKPDSKAEKLLAGKFKNADELEKGYKELEKKLGAKGKEAPPKDEGETEKAPEAVTDLKLTPKPDEVVPPKVEAAEKALADAGLKIDTFAEEFATNGELSEDSYKKLDKAGIPKRTVDAYIEGRKAVQAQTVNTIFESIGGREAFGELQGWARESLDPAEAKAFDESLKSGNVQLITSQLKGFQARMAAEVGTERPQVLGKKASAGDVYKSQNEITADMRDPRYKKGDPAFIRQVREKIERSHNAGLV